MFLIILCFNAIKNLYFINLSLKSYITEIYLQNCFSIIIKLCFSTHCLQKYIPVLLKKIHNSKLSFQFWLIFLLELINLQYKYLITCTFIILVVISITLIYDVYSKNKRLKVLTHLSRLKVPINSSKFSFQLWLKVFFLVRNNIIRSSLAKSNLVVNFLTSVIKICRTTCKNFSKIANFNFYITQTSLHINRTWVIALKYYYKSSFPSLIWHNLPQFVYMFSTFSCFIFYTQISYFILVFRTHISFSYFTFFSFIYILLDMMHIYECIQKNSTFD